MTSTKPGPFTLNRLLWMFGAVLTWMAIVTVAAPAALATGDDVADEALFYRDTGSFAWYEVSPSGGLAPIETGSGYSRGWDSIVAVDMDGGGQDEILFYRKTGSFTYYNVTPSAGLVPMSSGNGYSQGWDSIVALDIDGNGTDEIFFYRRSDGAFRYYKMKSNGSLGSPIRTGTGYTTGWDSIVALDMDGDGADEMFFYKKTGEYRYYDVTSSGGLVPIRTGSGYSQDWDTIVGIDMDGDRRDEMLFYRDDGTYRYYNVTASGSLSSPILSGTNYSQSWDNIVAVNLQGDLPIERVSRFTTFFDCCQNRVTNIRTMARAVDGTVVMPGETFSIDDVVGPRTSAKGYLPAPYLQNGAGQCCAIGGGVSQFGTTIHNAVFWGGYEVVDHRPHTGWISRYPLGIEATLVYHSIDYKFTNDTPTPVTIRTSSTSTSVTVEIWGNQGGWQVTGWHPRGARNSSISVIDQGGSQAKRVSAVVYGSAPGRVRIVRKLIQDGSPRWETWFWNYVS